MTASATFGADCVSTQQKVATAVQNVALVSGWKAFFARTARALCMPCGPFENSSCAMPKRLHSTCPLTALCSIPSTIVPTAIWVFPASRNQHRSTQCPTYYQPNPGGTQLQHKHQEVATAKRPTQSLPKAHRRDPQGKAWRPSLPVSDKTSVRV